MASLPLHVVTSTSIIGNMKNDSSVQASTYFEPFEPFVFDRGPALKLDLDDLDGEFA